LAFTLGESPGGAKENMFAPSPLRSFVDLTFINPRLKPWATFDRPPGL
jgi:hypothetical protein